MRYSPQIVYTNNIILLFYLSTKPQDIYIYIMYIRIYRGGKNHVMLAVNICYYIMYTQILNGGDSMGAMIIGIFSRFFMYLYLFFMFILVVFLFFVPAAILRFLLLKRPAEKSEWYKILKIESVICGVFTIISFIISLRYYSGGAEILKAVLSELICCAFEFGTIFCVQWLILRIPKNNYFSKYSLKKKTSVFFKDKTGLYCTTDYTYHDADNN